MIDEHIQKIIRIPAGTRTRRVRFGSAERDTLYGDSEVEWLDGGAGDDTLYVMIDANNGGMNRHRLRVLELDCREAA